MLSNTIDYFNNIQYNLYIMALLGRKKSPKQKPPTTPPKEGSPSVLIAPGFGEGPDHFEKFVEESALLGIGALTCGNVPKELEKNRSRGRKSSHCSTLSWCRRSSKCCNRQS